MSDADTVLCGNVCVIAELFAIYQQKIYAQEVQDLAVVCSEKKQENI